MEKRFNITGICLPELHYMMDTTQHMKGVMELIEWGEYFTINRPRQYGKTTTLKYIEDTLTDSSKYLCLKLSFEDVSSAHESAEAFGQMFAQKLTDELAYFPDAVQQKWIVLQEQITNLETLSKSISEWVRFAKKKVVVLIDEVDASSNYDAFLQFLAMLRNKYLKRYRRGQETFHSIVLAGVHDIKSLKFKVRNPEAAQYNSPWNIATDFEVRMSFIPSEMIPMLQAYSVAESVEMDMEAIADRLYHHTSGYPFLVCKLCKIIAEKLVPKKLERTWTLVDVEEAVQLLLKENNTNFDSLIKNLENHPDLYRLVERILLQGDVIHFNPHNPIIHKGVLYGVFKRNGQLRIHNRLYAQLLYNYMTSKLVTSLPSSANYGYHFLLEDHQLDMEGALRKFQQFMKEQYSNKSKGFIEHHGRILFLAFLAPILNGQGYAFREVQTSLEKRLDVIVTYFENRYIIELKRWYGPKAHQKGLDQLADYLDIHGVDDGYLVIFDDRKEQNWAVESIAHKDKQIFAVWV